MKRKKNSELICKRVSRKTSSDKNEKTLLDYWKPKIEKKKEKSKAKVSKSRSLSRENLNIERESKRTVIVKNPSKQMLVGTMPQSNMTKEYKKKILFNEDFVKNLKTILEPFFASLRAATCQSKYKLFDELLYDGFADDNIDSLIIKFLMQISDDFLFVPGSYISNNADKSKLKLIEGFNDNKYLSYQYHPSNSKEILDVDLVNNLTNYLKFFNKKKKKLLYREPKETKAFVIFDDRHVEAVKTIETICNDLDYKTIKLDEMENGKIQKLNKMSEATQSQRLSSLPEHLNERLKILEKIVNNDSSKFNFLLNGQILNYPSATTLQTHSQLLRNESGLSSFRSAASAESLNSDNSIISLNSVKSNAPITHYFPQDTKERTVYKTIEDNIYQICAKKKTLILIVDSFSHYEEDKNYLNCIMDKIPQSKCPIVILTKTNDGCGKINSSSLFGLLKEANKNIKDKFLFFKTSRTSDTKKKTVYLASFVLLFHTVITDIFNFINENEYSELGGVSYANSMNIQSILDLLKEKLEDKKLLNNLINEKVFEILVTISYKISLRVNWDLDSIFFVIYDLLRKNDKFNYKEKLNYLNVEFYQYEYLFQEIKPELNEIDEESKNNNYSDKTVEINITPNSSPRSEVDSFDAQINTINLVEEDEPNYNYNFEKVPSNTNDLLTLVKTTDYISFSDSIATRKLNASNKIYNKFYFSIFEQNQTIIKDISINKKDPHLNKLNEQLINCENVLIDFDFNPGDQERNLKLSKLYQFISKFDNWVKEVNLEDQTFYRSLLLDKIHSVTKRNLYDWNYLLNTINELDWETFSSLFGYRKPRSTRKITKEKESSEDVKLQGFQKVFIKHFNFKLMERFFDCHSPEMIYSVENLLFLADNTDIKYYTKHKTYEEIKPNETQPFLEYSENEYSSIDEEDSYSD